MALLWHSMACGMPYGMIIEIYLNFAYFPMPYKCHMAFVVRGIDCRAPKNINYIFLSLKKYAIYNFVEQYYYIIF